MSTKTETKDVFIKDEGDFVTVGFQTEKAKEIIREEKNAPLYDKDLPKMDIVIESKPQIISWLISHGLSWEEF